MSAKEACFYCPHLSLGLWGTCLPAVALGWPTGFTNLISKDHAELRVCCPAGRGVRGLGFLGTEHALHGESPAFLR